MRWSYLWDGDSFEEILPEEPDVAYSDVVEAERQMERVERERLKIGLYL